MKIITKEFTDEDLEMMRIISLKLLLRMIESDADCAEFSFPFNEHTIKAHIEFEVKE